MLNNPQKTLRDEFALVILHSLLITTNPTEDDIRGIYELADKMLELRNEYYNPA